MASTQRLKYLGHAIVFQEVPNEISLAINVSGCPYKCKGCHSSYLWEYKGRFISNDIENLLLQHDGITCVCFMGGDQNPQEMNDLITYIHSRNLKVCLYTGSDSIPSDIHGLDYIKIGHYSDKYGGLNCETTNQRFYKIINNKYHDITFMFQAKRCEYVKDS